VEKDIKIYNSNSCKGFPLVFYYFNRTKPGLQKRAANIMLKTTDPELEIYDLVTTFTAAAR